MDRADLDFANLPFAYQKTDANIRYWFRDGKLVGGGTDRRRAHPHPHRRDVPPLRPGDLRGPQGVRAPGRSRADLPLGRERPAVPALRPQALDGTRAGGLFREAVHRVVRANRRFVPPYGSGASLYVRPLLLGVSAEVGVKPSHDYLFLVLVTPVGPYYKGGLTPVRLIVEEQIDRAAPGGVGDAKCGGNYAAGMRATLPVKEKGYAEVLYLDCREKKYLDESGSSNFYAIIGKTFATPASPSILPSITNMSVQQIAKDMDVKVEQRQVSVDELPRFDEARLLGTAAVITPVESITYRGTDHVYAKDGKAGPITTELYRRLTAIQWGEAEDPYGWTEIIAEK